MYKTDTVSDVPYDRVCDSGLPTLLFYRPLKTLSWNNRVDNRDSVHNYSIDPEDEFDLPIHVTSPSRASLSAASIAQAQTAAGTGRLSATAQINMNMNGNSKAATATAQTAAQAAQAAAAAAAANAHRGSTDSQNGAISAKGRRGTGFMKGSGPIITDSSGDSEDGESAVEVGGHSDDPVLAAAAGGAAAARGRSATPWEQKGAPPRQNTAFGSDAAALAAEAASARGAADAAAIEAAKALAAGGGGVLIGPNGQPIVAGSAAERELAEAKKREAEQAATEKESCRMCQTNQNCTIM